MFTLCFVLLAFGVVAAELKTKIKFAEVFCDKRAFKVHDTCQSSFSMWT